jgi:predicted nucleic acid-binding protein
MAETPYLVDSNVLLRWVKPNHRDYPLIVSAADTILRRDGLLCYTSQNVGEFWNARTRPIDRNGYGLSPQDTDRLAKTFETRLQLLEDTFAVHEEWRRILVVHNVSGVQVHDARLVAAMRVHGVKQILTFNEKDFARYPDIEAVHPRAFSLT